MKSYFSHVTSVNTSIMLTTQLWYNLSEIQLTVWQFLEDRYAFTEEMYDYCSFEKENIKKELKKYSGCRFDVWPALTVARYVLSVPQCPQ